MQAVPSVSDVETQLFVAMVDANGDGALSEAELAASAADCAAIDAVVAAAGSAAAAAGTAAGTSGPPAAAAAAAPPAAAGKAAGATAGGGAAIAAAPAVGVRPGQQTVAAAAAAPKGMAEALAALVQHLRSSTAAVDAKLLQLNPVGEWVVLSPRYACVQPSCRSCTSVGPQGWAPQLGKGYSI